MFSTVCVNGEIFTDMDKDQVALIAGVTICVLSIGAFIFWGPNPRPKRRGAVVGLKNLGLTCFMNTLLQALASCPSFVEWMESCYHQGNVATALYYLLKVLSSERARLPPSVEDPVDPSTLIEALRQHGWAINRGEQDAHELFHLLMNTLEEEAHKANAAEGGLTDALEPKRGRCDSAPTLTDDAKDQETAVDEANQVTHQSSDDVKMLEPQSLPPTLRLVNKKGDLITRTVVPRYDCNRNYLVSPLNGMLTSQLQCVACGYKSVLKFDKFDSLSLHLPDTPHVRHTLTQLLDRFTHPEAVSGVACDGCNRKKDESQSLVKSTALKTLSIGKLPKCLCIHIHRMSIGNDGTPYKRRDYVDFPEFLFMDPYTHNSMILKSQKAKEESNTPLAENGVSFANNSLPCRTESGNHIYRLKAVVVHSGSADSGHFVTYRRGPLQSNTRHRSDRWYFTSDETVKDSSLAEAMQATAYMLFYEKCTMTPS